MTERTLVVIFFFWAMLTIITPTLILWSESAKTDPDFNTNDNYAVDGFNLNLELKVRKMTGYIEQHTRGSQTGSLEAPAAAPAPVMEQGMGSSIGIGTKLLKRVEKSHDIHNTTLKRSDKQKAKGGLLKLQRKLI